MIDCGVDLERFAPRDVAAARSDVGWSPDGTGFVCVGSLSERKNVLRLARAFERRGEGSLAFVGDGPLRPALEGRPGIHLAGSVEHDRVADWIAAADVVCQPSLHRAVRARDARRACLGPIGRRDAHRRPTRVRPRWGRCSRRPGRRRRPRRRARRSGAAAAPEPRGPERSRGARCQAAGGTGGGGSASSVSRSASLSSTSGLTFSSSPASRAAASAAR